MKIPDDIAYIPCNVKNHGGVRSLSAIRYLVYHYTANDGDSDTNNARYYSKAVNPPASAHYFVDDDSITQSVQDDIVAWAVGGSKWSDCAATGGGTLYGVVTNSNSISIEMCDTRRDGQVMSSEATIANAVALGKWLMGKYNIPVERVVRHFDVTGKHCPKWLMDNDRWAAFRARLTEEDDMKRYQTLDEIKKEAPWASDTIEKLCAARALSGDGTGLDLSYDMLRQFVANDRMGLYK